MRPAWREGARRELEAELRELASDAQRAGIALLALEGPPIARLVCRDAARRAATELRLVVREAQTGPLLGVLRVRGYAPAGDGGGGGRGDGVCRLGIMYCPQPEAALAEARRVLRPGGRAAYVVCGPLAGNPLLAAVNRALPELFGAPAAAGLPPPFRFAASGSLASPTGRAGFVGVEEHELRLTRTVPAASRFWQPTVELGLGIPLEALPPDTRQAIERTMLAAVQPGEGTSSYRLESHYRVAAGARPG